MLTLSALDYPSYGKNMPNLSSTPTLSFPKSLWEEQGQASMPMLPCFRSVQNNLKKLKEKQWQIPVAGSSRVWSITACQMGTGHGC